jgi:hypothetical protein
MEKQRKKICVIQRKDAAILLRIINRYGVIEDEIHSDGWPEFKNRNHKKYIIPRLWTLVKMLVKNKMPHLDFLILQNYKNFD